MTTVDEKKRRPRKNSPRCQRCGLVCEGKCAALDTWQDERGEPMTTINVEKLRRLAAEAVSAHPGWPTPWAYDGGRVVDAEAASITGDLISPHARYLAAASPDVVLALANEVATLRAEMELRDAALAEERAHADVLAGVCTLALGVLAGGDPPADTTEGVTVDDLGAALTAHAKRRGTR